MDNEQGSMSARCVRGKMVLAVAMAAVLLAAFLLSLGASRTARADTGAAYWAVCPAAGPGCDATSLQAAIDMAGDGDVIRVVGNSTYAENVVITKSLTLLGGCANAACNVRAPGIFVTTIDGGGAGRVVTIEGESDPITATVEGFVITGGDADAAVRHLHAGGGVGSWNANLVLMRNVITGNVASKATVGYGGGMYVMGGSVVISYNQVLSNHAAVQLVGEGGGMYLSDSEGEVVNNLIRDNVGNLGEVVPPTHGKGAGVYVKNCDPLTLTGNTIYSNTAALIGHGYGGGVYAEDSHLLIDQNTIWYNMANVDTHNGYGGGVHVRHGEIALSYNRILSNTASGAGQGLGGGIYMQGVTVTMAADTVMYNHATLSLTAGISGDGIGLYNGCTMTATNVVIARNQSPSTAAGEALYVDGTPLTSTLTLVNSSVISNSNAGYGLYCSPGVAGAVHLRVINSILWGNGNEVVGNCTSKLFAYSDIEDTEDSGPGVIHEDPSFVDPQNDDFHLNANSPCIDAGAAPDEYSFVPAVDWDGDARPAWQGYDIGADEVRAYDVCLPLVLREYE